MVIQKFHPSKKMGQSFLIDQNISKKIVNLINLKNHDCVIEIGPGKGALTQFLVNRDSKIIAIELDKRLAEFIKKKYPQIQIINDDVLCVNLDEILSQHINPILLSNLPYSISSPFLFQYINLENTPKFICMLQKEFVERLIAKPNTKQYGALSVIAQTYLQINKKLSVDKKCFSPQPKINSEVVEIEKTGTKINDLFINFVRACFQARRKTLVNNLKLKFSNTKLNQTLNNLKIDLNIRAQQISPNTFLQLFKTLHHEN